MSNRIEEEKFIVKLMIQMYCRHKRHDEELCRQCSELLDYALLRLDKCRFAANKPTCKKCPVHCYRQDMRELIQTIMQKTGPKMILYHPIIAIKHMVREIRMSFIRSGSKRN